MPDLRFLAPGCPSQCDGSGRICSTLSIPDVPDANVKHLLAVRTTIPHRFGPVAGTVNSVSSCSNFV